MIILHTSLGDIKIELDFENTPITAENFYRYANTGFYNNTIFHRVIEGFMVQGGGYEPGMKLKATQDPIHNEAPKGGPNKRGTIAMARTSDPHSATAQFFINVADNNFLNFTEKQAHGWGYCVFGRVVEGMDVVDAINKVATETRAGDQDVPVNDVIIERAEVFSKELETA